MSLCCWACHRREKKNYAVHVCELVKGSDSQLPRLPPNAKAKSRVKRCIQKIILVSKNHSFTRVYLRSQAAIAFEKRRHGISPYWWVIHPCSNFRLVWEIVMTIIFMYLFIMIPLIMSFHRLPDDNGTLLVKSLLYLTPGYAVCLIDVLLNFFTGYTSPDGHEIFLEPSLIIRNYLRKFFIIDLVSSIPYTWFYSETLQVPTENSDMNLLILELLPLLKLFRLSRLRQHIKQLIMNFRISQVKEHMVWLIILTILIFHWAACFTYVIPFFYAYLCHNDMETAEGLLFNTKLYKAPVWYRYLTSLHMGGGNLCSYSFREFSRTDVPDKFTRCVLLTFGTSYYIYLIVVLLQVMGSSVEPELKYQSIMQDVKSYIENKKLPTPMKSKVLNFFEHRFQGILFKEKAITSTLSKHLKSEIIQHSSRVLLENSPLFVNLSRSLLTNIVGALKQIIFLQDDIIYKCKADGKSMYFIAKGTVAVISCSGREICHLKDGDYFGESALITHEHKRKTTIIALEVCELLRLDRRDFSREVPPKSEFFERLEAVTQRRSQIIKDFEAGKMGTANDSGMYDYVSKNK